MGVIWRKAEKTAETRDGRAQSRPQGKAKVKGKVKGNGKRR